MFKNKGIILNILEFSLNTLPITDPTTPESNAPLFVE